MTRKALAWSLAVSAGIATIASYSLLESRRHRVSLAARIEQIMPVGKHLEVSCAEVASNAPLVLLALGQSNAGNHGLPSVGVMEPVTMIAEGKCIRASDPLPGGTGTGGSIWQRLPALLSKQKDYRPIVLSVLAVDATSIDDWTNPNSPLQSRLASQVASMKRLGLPPNLVLWQQGEADARMGTGKDDYARGLGRLATTLNESGVNAPIILAKSTICRSSPSEAIRSAVEAAALSDLHFRLGPDTDALSGQIYRSGCHLTADGLNSAAKMWAASISAEVSAISLPSQASFRNQN